MQCQCNASSFFQFTGLVAEPEALTEFNSGVVREQDISGLDVTVNEVVAVQILEAVKCLVADCANLLLTQRLLVNYKQSGNYNLANIVSAPPKLQEIRHCRDRIIIVVVPVTLRAS